LLVRERPSLVLRHADVDQADAERHQALVRLARGARGALEIAGASERAVAGDAAGALAVGVDGARRAEARADAAVGEQLAAARAQGEHYERGPHQKLQESTAAPRANSALGENARACDRGRSTRFTVKTIA